MKPGKFQIRFADIIQHTRQFIYIAVLIYIIYIYHHIIYLYISVFVDVDTTNKEIPRRFHQTLPGEDADAAAKQLQDREQKVEDQVGRSLKEKKPNGGGLVREFPGYFRKIQVGEILFHLTRPIKTKWLCSPRSQGR